MRTRNLIQILTGDLEDDDTDHCMAVPYGKGNLSIDLWSLLGNEAVDVSSNLTFFVGGYQNRTGVVFMQEFAGPELDDATVVHVEVARLDTLETLDRFWLVVYSQEMRTDYQSWYAYESSHLAWVSLLPQPPAVLTIVDTTPPSAYVLDEFLSQVWTIPEYVRGNYMHHAAVFSIRTVQAVEGHGNQACYDEAGNIILSTISAGTADFAQGDAQHVFAHVPHDVLPYYHALWLDGNPAARLRPMNSMSRPCLYQGDNLNKYLQCRPTTPPTGGIP